MRCWSSSTPQDGPPHRGRLVGNLRPLGEAGDRATFLCVDSLVSRAGHGGGRRSGRLRAGLLVELHVGRRRAGLLVELRVGRRAEYGGARQWGGLSWGVQEAGEGARALE